MIAQHKKYFNPQNNRGGACNFYNIFTISMQKFGDILRPEFGRGRVPQMYRYNPSP